MYTIGLRCEAACAVDTYTTNVMCETTSILT